MYGLFTCYAYENIPDGKWIVFVSFLILVMNAVLFIRIKRRRVELYREEAQALYISTIISLPLAQWITHNNVFLSTFPRLGPYRYVEMLCLAAWMGVLIFNFAVDLPDYHPNPNRKHWSCRLRRIVMKTVPKKQT